MPTTNSSNLLNTSLAEGFLKGVVLLILIFYAIFALLIVRQVDLMGKTLITPVSGVVKAIAIIHGGFAIGLIVLIFGIL
ncbi:MAG: hypothetical protein Q8P92_04580 [Candidatus Daviesbacteria bacterium]|nr:hypothetical protein [Candidatus Daviesbacteria bacterium]